VQRSKTFVAPTISVAQSTVSFLRLTGGPALLVLGPEFAVICNGSPVATASAH
jgi:hypothetical protein